MAGTGATKEAAAPADARARWQQTLRYLLVDEVQDTNARQYELMKLLSSRLLDAFTHAAASASPRWRSCAISRLGGQLHDDARQRQVSE